MRRLFFLTILACAPQEQALPPDTAVVVIPSASAATPSATIPAPPPTLPPIAGNANPGSDLRDPRPPTRSLSMITAELQGLQSLLAATAKTAPDRPQLIKRCGDAAAEVRKASTDAATARAAGQKAIAYYAQVISEYPAFTSLDEARYYLGLEYEIAGDAMNARRSYYELIKSHPSSRFIPLAYFAFGEMFLKEALSDPTKWSLAEMSYREVLKYTNSAIIPEALWRAGQVKDAQNDQPAATQFYARLRNEFPNAAATARIGQKP